MLMFINIVSYIIVTSIAIAICFNDYTLSYSSVTNKMAAIKICLLYHTACIPSDSVDSCPELVLESTSSDWSSESIDE